MVTACATTACVCKQEMRRRPTRYRLSWKQFGDRVSTRWYLPAGLRGAGGGDSISYLMVVDKTDLASGLTALGVGRGSKLMVHSSLSSFGRFRGGAEAVIEALMDAIGCEGTLMMPSFNHGAPFRLGGPGVYDPRKTSTTNGRIPDTFWRMNGVLRSLNPTHPFAVWGVDSDWYVDSHHKTLTMGADSPLGRLWRHGGLVVLIGVGYGSNTFHHVVETVTGAPCLGRRTEAYPVRLPAGGVVEMRTWGWRSEACPLTDLQRYGDIMLREGLERGTTVGSAVLTAFETEDCFRVVSQVLAEGRDGYPPCSACPIRPRTTAATRQSDWDAAAGAVAD